MGSHGHEFFHPSTVITILFGFFIVFSLFGCITTTDVEPPYIESTSPLNLQTNVSSNVSIVIRFNEPMDNESIETALIITPLIEGSLSWNTEGTEMTFNPTNPLAPNTRYNFTIQATVRDQAGNQMMAPHDFSFTVAKPQPPQPELVGNLVWVKSHPEDIEWESYQGKKLDFNLVFKPKVGWAEVVDVYLDLGSYMIIESRNYKGKWIPEEGLYTWRFVPLTGQTYVGVSMVSPLLSAGMFEQNHTITLYYSYPEKPRIILDRKTLTVKMLPEGPKIVDLQLFPSIPTDRDDIEIWLNITSENVIKKVTISLDGKSLHEVEPGSGNYSSNISLGVLPAGHHTLDVVVNGLDRDTTIKRDLDILVADWLTGPPGVIEVNSTNHIVWKEPNYEYLKDVERLPNGNTMILGQRNGTGVNVLAEVTPEGEEIWSQPAPKIVDVEVLQNGNLLLTNFPGDRVYETDRLGNVSFELTWFTTQDIDLLPNGNVLVAKEKTLMELNETFHVVRKIGVKFKPWDIDYLSNGNIFIFKSSRYGTNYLSEIDFEGNVIWKGEKTWTKDVDVLDNGNLLITQGSSVREINRSTGQTVWDHRSISSSDLELLPSGNFVMFAGNIFEVNRSTGEIEWELTTPSSTTHGSVLDNGNFLIPGGKGVQEINSTGHVVKEFNGYVYRRNGFGNVRDVDQLPNGNIIVGGSSSIFEIAPNTALKYDTGSITPVDVDALPDGNFMWVDVKNNQVVEINQSYNQVWSRGELENPCDADRMPNGHTLVLEKGTGRLLEINNEIIVWELPIPGGEGNDVELLPNGNFLITNGYCIIEINRTGQIVWQRCWMSPPNEADRLPNGNTLIVTGSGTREVDQSGHVVWSSSVGGDKVERLPNGNTLIIKISGNVFEVNSTGEIVWKSEKVYGMRNAIRLLNGKTLVARERQIVELDPDGNISIRIIGIKHPTDAEKLENNYTLITDNERIIKVDPRGNIEGEYKTKCREIEELPKGDLLIVYNNLLTEVNTDWVKISETIIKNIEDAEILENGNYLIAQGNTHKVLEIEKNGSMIQEIWPGHREDQITQMYRPINVERLHNGNTLIAFYYGEKTQTTTTIMIVIILIITITRKNGFKSQLSKCVQYCDW